MYYGIPRMETLCIIFPNLRFSDQSPDLMLGWDFAQSSLGKCTEGSASNRGLRELWAGTRG